MNRFFNDLVGVVEQAVVERVAGYVSLVVRDELGLVKYLINPSIHIDVKHDDSPEDIKKNLLNAMHEDIPHNANKE